jgi:ferric-dicitrate binding protein FerR (iron transport regulator)
MAGRLSELGAEVRTSLEDARAKSGAAERVRKRLASGDAPREKARPRIRRGVFVATAWFAAAAAIVVGAYVSWPARTASVVAEPLTFVVATERGVVGAFLSAPAEREIPVAFSDGTRVRLAPSARARIAEVSPHGARVLLESGVVHAEVAHLPGARWAIDAGPFEVKVTGTKFDVGWEPSEAAIVVTLQEGSVLVTGCTLGEGRRVVAGERLRVSCSDPAKVARAPEPPVATPESLPDAPASAVVVASAPPAPVVVAPPPPDVARLLSRGANAEALSLAETNGFASTCDTLGAADLLALAGAARYAKNFDRADEALRAVRRRFPGTDAAAAASFELGRIAFDARRDYASAGDAFDTYLRERPSGSLAREALGRALEARTKSGDPRATTLASRYLAAYPDGPHAALARRISGATP